MAVPYPYGPLIMDLYSWPQDYRLRLCLLILCRLILCRLILCCLARLLRLMGTFLPPERPKRRTRPDFKPRTRRMKLFRNSSIVTTLKSKRFLMLRLASLIIVDLESPLRVGMAPKNRLEPLSLTKIK